MITRSELDLIGEAKTFEKSPYIKDGMGVLLIEEISYSRKTKGPTFVARMQVVESKPNGDLDPVTKQPTVPNGVGTEVAYVQLPQLYPNAAGDIKAFLCNVLGTDANSVSKEEFSKTLAQAADIDPTSGEFVGKSLGPNRQPMRGMLVRYSTYQKETQKGANKGRINTYVKFSHIKQGNSPEEIAARRAELDATRPLK